MSFTFIRTALCLLAASAPAAVTGMHAVAQDAPARDSVVVLDEILVEDSARVFDAATIRIRRLRTHSAGTDRAGSVAEILAGRSTIDLRLAGPTGTATASIRGAGAAGTPVVMDGFRLADPQTGVVDLSMIPMAQVQSVELVHGPSGHAGALGGSVVLRSRRPSDVGDAFSAAAGAFGERTLSLSAGGSRGGFEGSVAAVTTRVDGDFTYMDTAAFPAREEVRHGAGRQTSSVSVSGRRQIAGGSIRLFTWYSDAVRGMPGPANAAGPGAVMTDRLLRSQIAVGTRLGRIHLDGGLSTTRSGRAWNHPQDGERTFEGAVTTLRLNAMRIAGGSWVMESGLRLSRESARVHGQVRRDLIDMETRLLRTAKRLTVEAGMDLAGDRIGAEILPSAGVRLGVAPGVDVRASAARSFRRPTLNELYWVPGGNPDLKSERGYTFDAGIAAERRLLGVRWTADAGVYTGRIDERITWQPALAGAGVRIWRPVNVGRVKLRGAEAGLEGGLDTGAGAWTLSIHGSRTDVLDRSNSEARSWGRQLRYVPVAAAVWHLDWERGAWAATLGARWTGRRYTSSDESLHLDGWHVATVGAARRVLTKTAAIRIGLTIENIGNADYEVMRLYPMPPRHATFTISVTSRPSDS